MSLQRLDNVEDPPQTQHMMEEPIGGQTLAHMLRMAGELRAEGGGPPAKAAADLGLRQVLRPKASSQTAMTGSTSAVDVCSAERALLIRKEPCRQVNCHVHVALI